MGDRSCFAIFMTFVFVFIIGVVIGRAYFLESSDFINGTFVKNGTDEYYWLQYMDYNKKELMKSYDLQQVIAGNFCEQDSNYITDITPQSFRIQCCKNLTSCENYVVVNKQIKEVGLR